MYVLPFFPVFNGSFYQFSTVFYQFLPVFTGVFFFRLGKLFPGGSSSGTNLVANMMF